MEDIVDRLRVLNFKGPWQEAADEIERLREALKFYACGCEEGKCVVTKPKFKGIRCGKMARDAMKEGNDG